MTENPLTRYLGLVEYGVACRQMTEFTAQRNGHTRDEFWCLQHFPVFTLGLGGKQKHVLNPGTIPVISTDRGGQVTYHGPGQLVLYTMIDLRRLQMTVKRYVCQLEQAIINFCMELNIDSGRKTGMPGVYAGEKKIAALGIRIRQGYCYHGVALNVAMDLEPYERINPCGFPDLEVTQLSHFGFTGSVDDTAAALVPHLFDQLGYQVEQCIDKGETKNKIYNSQVA